MGKRSNFERIDKDYYKTPKPAILPLIPYITNIKCYIEPCAGDGQLINILKEFNKTCIFASDIEPKNENITEQNILEFDNFDVDIITNPPWDRKLLHPILDKIINNKSNINCWLLFDANWIHTKQSSEYIKYCHKIISVGRIKWFPDTKMVGKDDCAWYLFKNTKALVTQFIGR